MKEVVREALILFFRTFDPVYRHTLKKANRILTSNYDTFEAVPARYQPKTLVHSQVGTDPFPQPKPSDDERGFHIVYGGLFQHLKGISFAIRSFVAMHEMFPDARLTLIGHGPEMERIQELIRNAPDPNRIQILSWLPQDKFHRELAKGDVLLFPSFHDSGGLVIIEAMAMGIPVICLDRAGPAFLVSDQTGIKVPIESPEQVQQGLTDALIQLAGNPERCKQMGAAAKRRVDEHFLWKRKSEQLQSIYRDVLAER